MKAYLARAHVQYVDPRGWLGDDTKDYSCNDILLGLFSTPEKAEDFIASVNAEDLAANYTGENICDKAKPSDELVYYGQVRAVYVLIEAGWKLFVAFSVFEFELDKALI